ncbi:hypothetical protein [Floridanema evergladense]|uniref:Uncharacterized protein n=1 Tax=Floridaenema evergladense BLCC-F167 TaxID=3153639 RepID=A0ABV4WRR2_9CYAN
MLFNATGGTKKILGLSVNGLQGEEVRSVLIGKTERFSLPPVTAT